jgi:hypothetical protein
MSGRFPIPSNGMDGSDPVPHSCEKDGCRYSSSRAHLVVNALLIVSFFIGFSLLTSRRVRLRGDQDHVLQTPDETPSILLIHNYARGNKACFACV